MITIKEYREWINSIPSDFDDCQMVFREIEKLDEDNLIAKDRPIVAVGIDDGTKEAYLCDGDSAKILNE